MTRANDDAAAALTFAGSGSGASSDAIAGDPFLQGQQAFWSRQRTWDMENAMSPDQLAGWQRGYAAAHDSAVCSAASETRVYIKTWINALYDAASVLERLCNDAPPKSPSLRQAVRNTRVRINTALAYVPPEFQIGDKDAAP